MPLVSLSDTSKTQLQKSNSALIRTRSVASSLKNEVYELVKRSQSLPTSASQSLEQFIEAKKLEDAQLWKEATEDETSQTSSMSGVKSVNAEEVMKQYEVTPNDTNDPSYTNLTLPYSVICRQRLRKAARKQREQFLKELKAHELLRARALDGVRIHREFCNPIISSISPVELVTLSRRQKEKLEQLLLAP